jgi:catechol 2,3-dioxygenase-like lactoylglutathione lyase family enzyme
MTNIEKVGRVLVPVSDQDRAIAWYRDRLGFELVADIPFGDGDRWVEIAPPGGGAALALVPGSGDYQPGRNTGVGFETGDARALYDEFAAKGIVLAGELMGGDGTVPPLFFFKDLDGNTLLVAEVQGRTD